MRVLSSLTNRIFLACTLLATLSLGFAFYFVNETVSRESEVELRRELEKAGTLVDQHRTTLTDTFTHMARLVADLPRLKAAVETGDAPTVQPVAYEYNREFEADTLVITGRRGEVLAMIGFDAEAFPAAMPHHDPDDELSTLWAHPHGLLQVVSVPIVIEPSEVLGRLTVGFFLGDRLAQQFKDITGSEIAFGARGQILASTLPTSSRAQLATAARTEGMSTVTIGDEEFIALRRALGNADVSPVALILRSRTEQQGSLRTIRNVLAGALIVMLLLATILSFAVALTVTRPLAAITHAMHDIAATGDLTRKVSLHTVWDDEDARLLATTFNTLTDSIARFQKEAAQKERLSSLGRLSTVVAHEIRNPLMIIKAALRSLRRDQIGASELREAVADIDEETTRLNRIVTEVLDFARPIRFDFAEVKLNAICSASAAAAAAGELEPPIALELDRSDPVIVTDPERLRTALVNILSNARHAVQGGTKTASGGVAVLAEPLVRIETRLVPPEPGRGADAGRVVITVRDRGIGIAHEELPHIFEPYFTTRRTGTGLGLPITKNIIEGLGGTITVSSRVGEGTEIRIDLPVAPAGPRA